MEEVTADDIRLALVPLSKKSEGLYNKVNMLLKCIFYTAERNQILEHNPCAGISGKGGKPTKKKEALTDQQVAVLLDTVKGLPPYLFIMLGLYSGLRREEILALQWDCVFLDEDTPYLSVRRAWRTEHNRPVVSTVLKTPAAKRDIPIPKCLVECLREAKENSISDYVIADSKGEPLAASQFQRVWQYVVVRSTKPRNYYKYVNGESIKYTVILIDCQPSLGMLTVNALAAANRIIIPVQAEYLPAKGLEQLLSTVSKVKRQINPKLQIDGILLTMVDNRTNFAKEIAALLRDTYGSKIKVFGTEIPHSVRAKEISAEGKSIFAHYPGGKVAEGYRNLTKEVLKLEKQREKSRAGIGR